MTDGGTFLRYRLYWLGGLLMLCISPVWAQDGVLTIEGTRIRGDQESPTVLYLVPWQPPGVESLAPPEASFMVGRAIKPLERSQFQRVLSYHEQFKAMNAPESAAPQAAEDGSE